MPAPPDVCPPIIFMKAFKLLFVFLLIAAAVLGGILALNWTAFKVVFSDPQAFSEGSEWIEKTYSLAGLTEYMQANPEHVSVVSLHTSNPDGHVMYNETEPRVMGAVGNIFLLIEYVNQLEEGRISEDDEIDVDDINQFVVPSWYESGHATAMEQISDGSGEVLLSDVITLATEHYSQAASDWLFFHLGPDRINALIEELGEGKIEPWIPGSGIQVAITLRDKSRNEGQAAEDLLELPIDERAGLFTDYARRYAGDAEFADEVEANSTHIRNRLISHERIIHGLWSKAEPLRLTEIAMSVVEAELVSEASAALIASYLDWVSEDPVVQQHTDEYNALFGSRLGYLTGLDYGTSTYTGARYVQTVFFDDLPVAFYMHMSSNFMNQDLQRRMIYDPDMRRLVDMASKNELEIELPETNGEAMAQ
jgi:hypothetical protein